MMAGHEIIDGVAWDTVVTKDLRVVFHFNKKHNEDVNIPPWVLKVAGKTYYCDSVKASVPFSTKNTPGNEATKGSLMFRGTVKLSISRYIDDLTCEPAYDAEIVNNL